MLTALLIPNVIYAGLDPEDKEFTTTVALLEATLNDMQETLDGLQKKSLPEERVPLYHQPKADPPLAEKEIGFADLPMQLKKIALCESGGRHTVKGKVIRGVVNNQDIGMLQINLKHHNATATQMGYDLFDANDNMAYGLWLYEQKGVSPWRASARCWRKK